jgi:hypothetical protein
MSDILCKEYSASNYDSRISDTLLHMTTYTWHIYITNLADPHTVLDRAVFMGVYMAVSNEQWDNWLRILEDILHDADVGGAIKFAIHLNSAIEEAHISRGTERIILKSDHIPNDDAIS